MRRCLAVALILAGAALPLCAQRGGGARGGFSGHAAGSFGRAAPAFASRPSGFSGFAPGNRYGYRGGSPAGSRAVGVPYSVQLARPSFYTRRPVSPVRPVRPYRPGYPGYGVGFYGYPGYLAYDGLGYDLFDCDPAFDDCYADNSYYGAPGYNDQGQGYSGNPNDSESGQAYYGPAGPPPQSYGEPAPEGYAQQPGYAAPPPYPEYTYQQPSAAVEPSQSPSQLSSDDQDTITLIFKDGRPPEQIRNYALTRSTLYVLRGSHRQEIPVDQLNLAATEKANQNAGVDFQLPHPPNQTSGPAAR